MTAAGSVGRVIAGVTSAAIGVFWLLWAFVVVSSRFSTDPADDPHGFGLIFGTFLATVTGFIFPALVPFAFRQQRRRVARIAGGAYLLITALLFTAWLTA